MPFNKKQSYLQNYPQFILSHYFDHKSTAFIIFLLFLIYIINNSYYYLPQVSKEFDDFCCIIDYNDSILAISVSKYG